MNIHYPPTAKLHPKSVTDKFPRNPGCHSHIRYKILRLRSCPWRSPKRCGATDICHSTEDPLDVIFTREVLIVDPLEFFNANVIVNVPLTPLMPPLNIVAKFFV